MSPGRPHAPQPLLIAHTAHHTEVLFSIVAIRCTTQVALEAGDECPVCLGQLEQPVITAACAHVFCEACVRALLDRAAPQPVPCPLCRGTVEPLGLIGT